MKFHKPLKLKKGQIDLRGIGAQQQHEEGIARMHAVDRHTTLHDEAGDLVILEGAPTPLTPPTPAYSPVYLTPKQAFLLVRNIITREILALRP